MTSKKKPAAPLTAEQEQAIRKNIFAAAHGAISDWRSFKWHRTRDGFPDAYVPHSSQAFCISVWGTIASVEGQASREVAARLLGDDLVAKALGSYGARPLPLELESNRRDLLNEYGGTQSHLDGVLALNGLSMVVESKLTEPLGCCSQAKDGHCSGVYGPGSDLKLRRTDVPCRLTYEEGRRSPRLYWNVMKELGPEDAYHVGEPCPFGGHGYQVMRNVAAAAKLAGDTSEWRVVFAYPLSYDPATDKAIGAIHQKLADKHRHRVLVLDYIALARELMSSKDRIARGLGKHMAIRLGIQPTPDVDAITQATTRRRTSRDGEARRH